MERDIRWDEQPDEAVELCGPHGMPLPCCTCGRERWRVMISPLLPGGADRPDIDDAAH